MAESQNKTSVRFHFGGNKDDDDLLAKLLVNQAFLEHDFVLEIRIISLK